jgi:hypothetical protein
MDRAPACRRCKRHTHTCCRRSTRQSVEEPCRSRCTAVIRKRLEQRCRPHTQGRLFFECRIIERPFSIQSTIASYFRNAILGLSFATRSCKDTRIFDDRLEECFSIGSATTRGSASTRSFRSRSTDRGVSVQGRIGMPNLLPLLSSIPEPNSML